MCIFGVQLMLKAQVVTCTSICNAVAGTCCITTEEGKVHVPGHCMHTRPTLGYACSLGRTLL